MRKSEESSEVQRVSRGWRSEVEEDRVRSGVRMRGDGSRKEGRGRGIGKKVGSGEKAVDEETN